MADLSPYYDEEEEFPTLRSNSNQAVEYDGDHHLEPPNLSSSIPPDSKNIKEVKEVQALVRNIVNHSNSLLPSSSENWPGFVNLLEPATEGMIDAFTTPFNFKMCFKAFGGHFLGQTAKAFRQCILGANPAKGKNKELLVDLLTSNLFDTLGNER